MNRFVHMGTLLSLLISNAVSCLYATETTNEYHVCLDSTKKYLLSICAIFRNESENLSEWIDYHYNLGVDHFYLYNVESKDSFRDALNPYIRKDIITLVNWPNIASKEGSDLKTWILNTQVTAYENAVNFISRDETKWLMFMDIDDYLVCPKGSIKDLLLEYDDCPGISLSSHIVAKSEAQNLSKQTTIIQPLVRTTLSPTDRFIAKMIFKPDQCDGFIWPPYQCKFTSIQKPKAASKKDLYISHYPKKNPASFIVEKKILHPQNAVYSANWRNESQENIIYLSDEDEEGVSNLPIYECTPEFLKQKLHHERFNLLQMGQYTETDSKLGL